MAPERADGGAGGDSAVRIYPTQYWFAGTGGPGTVTLVAPEDFAWQASASEGWISSLSPTSGKGSARIAYAVQPNEGAYRHGKLTVAGLELFILQLAQPKWQEQQVLGAPLPYIEQVGLKGFLDKANKLPPPARAAAYSAIIGAVTAAIQAGEALYLANPQVPQTYTPHFWEHEQMLALQFIIEHMGGGE